MTKEQAIVRLCKLVSKVGAEQFHSNETHDCFCEESSFGNPIISEKVIAFIEEAVEEKIYYDSLP